MMSRGEHQQELTETKYDKKGLTVEQNLSNPESSSRIGHRNLFSRFLWRVFSRSLPLDEIFSTVPEKCCALCYVRWQVE